MEASRQEAPRKSVRKRTTLGNITYLIGKWVLIAMMSMVLLLGLFDVYDFMFPEYVPEVRNIGMCLEAELAEEVDQEWTELSDDLEYNWLKIQPALLVLDKVCPEAAKWVVDRHDKKKIIWDKTNDGTFARYDNFQGNLILNQLMIHRRHGDIAVTLAHEYRHSKQNFTKTAKAAMFLAFTGVFMDHFVENDAVQFEKEVYIAIFE